MSSFAYRTSLSGERTRSLGEANFIAAALEKEISDILQKGSSIDKEGYSFFLRYANYYSDRGVTLELWQNDTLLIGSIPGSQKTEYNTLPREQISRVIEIDKEKYMLVTNTFWSYSEKYTLVYAHDLKDFTEEHDVLFRFFIILGVVLTALLAIGLYLVLRRLSKPIEKLDQATGYIAGGDYSMRVPVQGKDELAALAKHFNRMTHEIEDRMKELQKTAEQKQRFIDNLAHELRTPLTTIRGYAEYLKNANISEDERIDSVDFIITESVRIEEMANKLLDLALMRAGALEITEINLQILLESVANKMSSKLLEKKIQLDLYCEQCSIKGEGVLLESLLCNLLDNAIKASKPGTCIQLSGLQEGKQCVIKIRDFGKGLPSEHITKLTEPFYRPDKARSRSEGGAGLGLALCKQIAELHKARLLFSSEVGEGTLVKIEFTTP